MSLNLETYVKVFAEIATNNVYRMCVCVYV